MRKIKVCKFCKKDKKYKTYIKGTDKYCIHQYEKYFNNEKEISLKIIFD